MERRIGYPDPKNSIDKIRIEVFKVNKTITKRLLKKQKNPETYRNTDYELSDSNESEVASRLSDDEEREFVAFLKDRRRSLRDEIEELYKKQSNGVVRERVVSSDTHRDRR